MTTKPALPEQPATGQAVSSASPGKPGDARLPGGATAQDILSALGQTVYEWDIASDRIRWGANAAGVLGLSDMGALVTGDSYDAHLHPDSVTDRHQAVLNGIGVDYGSGVPFSIAYALKLTTAVGPRTVWVEDDGLWFADAAGRPYLARGVIRLKREGVGSAPMAPARDLPRRVAFLRSLGDVLAMASHYKTTYAFAVASIDSLGVVADLHSMAALEEAETAVAERVRSSMRSGDVAGWMGDRELGLILSVGDETEAVQAVDRIVRVIQDPAVSTSAGPVELAVRAGVAVIPVDTPTVDECVSRARSALREAQASRSDRPLVYAPGMPDTGGAKRASRRKVA